MKAPMPPAQHSPHWHILGAGAIGSLWSAYWQQQHFATTVISRRHSGPRQLELIAPQSRFAFSQQQLTAVDLEQEIQQLLITTKAHQCLAAFNSIQHRLSDDAVIVVLQNGMAVNTLPTRAQQRLYAATTTDGAHFKNDKTLVHAGQGETYLGPINAYAKQLPADALMQQLPSALHLHYCLDIEQRLWRKLAINCAINALGVKYQCRNGELISNAAIRQELIDLCQEISMVAAALELGPWFDNLYQEVAKVAQLTHNNINSTLQDINQGKTTEIIALNGYLCDIAKSLQLATPLNQALLELVLANSPAQ
ncbi:2-dehydropantoate 2-reductase [Dasania sp. GY-20]|nr:2-dehydropantoate 2-reductase [Dasania phycosphaerae]